MADTLVWRTSQPHTCNSIVRPFLSLYSFILVPLYLNHLSTTIDSYRIESHLMKASECVGQGFTLGFVTCCESS